MRLNDALSVVNEELDFIFENDAAFLAAFSKGNTMLLVSVHFSGSDLRIVYVLDCGQHVVDTVQLEDYSKWKQEVLQNNSELS